eukprot:883229_1
MSSIYDREHLAFNYSLAYQIVYLIGCLYIILQFSHICYLIAKHILFNKQSIIRQKHFSMILIAFILWMCIIMAGLVEFLLRTNLIIPFKSSGGYDSSEDGGHVELAYCTWYGRIRFFLFTKYILCIQLLFLEAIKQAFYPKQSATIRGHIPHFVCVCLNVACDVVMLQQGEYHSEGLRHQSSKYLCEAENVFAIWEFTLIMLISLVSLIVICAVFIFKTYQLIIATPQKVIRGNSKKKVEGIISVNIKQSLLITTVLLSFTILINVDALWIICLCVLDLIIGLFVYILFDFGEQKYQFIFGRIHRSLLNIWRRKHVQSEFGDLNSQSEHDVEMADVEAPQPPRSPVSRQHESMLQSIPEEMELNDEVTEMEVSHQSFIHSVDMAELKYIACIRVNSITNERGKWTVSVSFAVDPAKKRRFDEFSVFKRLNFIYFNNFRNR